MRPAGDERSALLKAATELTTAVRAPTMRELMARSCVGKEAARRVVNNMTRAGVLSIVRTRKVDYRNKPVAEYAPAVEPGLTAAAVAAELGNVFKSWVR